jgi:hypothetical protein
MNVSEGVGFRWGLGLIDGFFGGGAGHAVHDGCGAVGSRTVGSAAWLVLTGLGGRRSITAKAEMSRAEVAEHGEDTAVVGGLQLKG